MKVIITGASGFIGANLADALLSNNSQLPVKELILVDIVEPTARPDPRVRTLTLDLASPDAALQLIDATCDIFFHIATVPGEHSEMDFDRAFKDNFDATWNLLEAARKSAPKLKFIFTSSIAVYKKSPSAISHLTAVTPVNTYGTTKAMCELLINEYSRKGFVDGRVIRLPIVVVRGSAPNNRSFTVFVSRLIQDPLNGKEVVCPVPKSQNLWITSYQVAIKNIIHAAVLPTSSIDLWRVVTSPGIRYSVEELIQALGSVAGENVAKLVKIKEDDKFIEKFIKNGAYKFDNTHALSLGFSVDSSIAEIIKVYIRDDLKANE